MKNEWHHDFNPQSFLNKINVDEFIEQNNVKNENIINNSNLQCLLCNNKSRSGLILNNKQYLCKSCFDNISYIQYPEKYENLKRTHIKNREARIAALEHFINKSLPLKISPVCNLIAVLNLYLIFSISYNFIPLSIIMVFISVFCNSTHEKKQKKWEKDFPIPEGPNLKHFHNPKAVLSERDRKILLIFNHWPGYPPFWKYLRNVVLKRDKFRCQVTGCPSRLDLHIHHKTSVSKGGEHTPGNLVTLCDFHHALEPDAGHERVWGNVKTRYFTIVRDHKRKNKNNEGLHKVKTHIRRLELISYNELKEIIKHYQISCNKCGNENLNLRFDKTTIQIICTNCFESWSGKRELCEETGPIVSDILRVNKNKGSWKFRKDMLDARTERVWEKTEKKKSTFRVNTDRMFCPKCNIPMRLVKPKTKDNWKSFWGCRNYPTCKFTINMN